MKLSCEGIETRHSCRLFNSDQIVPDAEIDKLLYAASLAPSGKNTQPWRFRIISGDQISQIAALLPINKWFSRCKQAICVFSDTASGYDAEKDAMAIGACVENILIEAESNGISACWIGECTDYREQIASLLEISSRYKIMAIVAFGYSKKYGVVNKHPIEKLMI